MPREDDPQIGLSMAIRQLRLEAELSQEALGLTVGIHPTWISHIESGRVNPRWGNVRRIAEGLEVPLQDLAALAEDFEAKHGTAPQPRTAGGGRKTTLGWLRPTLIPRRSQMNPPR